MSLPRLAASREVELCEIRSSKVHFLRFGRVFGWQEADDGGQRSVEM
jgi:hypothetical protein